MDWMIEFSIALRAVVAAALGFVIGLERQWQGQEAGVRTFAAVALGASAFAAISVHLPSLAGPDAANRIDPSRIASNIVGAIGFLGAGVILRDRDGRTKGLTTSATIWATAAVGMAAGFGMFALAIILDLTLLLVLISHRFVPRFRKPADESADS